MYTAAAAFGVGCGSEVELNGICKDDALEWDGRQQERFAGEMILLRAERTVTSAFWGIFALVLGGEGCLDGRGGGDTSAGSVYGGGMEKIRIV